MKKKYIFLIAALTICLAVVVVYYIFPDVAFKLLLKAERSSAGLKQHSIKVEGLHIEYLEGGQGDVVLLLHGFGANKDNWTRISKHFTPHFRVIAPDLPGFGDSSRQPDLNYTIAAQAVRVHAFVRTLGLQSFHLGGSSMGGNIAGVYAAQHPENVISLWLVAPGGVASADPSEMERELNAGRPNPLVVESVEDYKRLIDFIFIKKPFIPGPMLNQLAKEAIRNSPLNQNIFKQIHEASNITGLESTLNGSLVTTLILWGANDRVLHVSGAKILESVMPKAQVAIMEGVGHLPMIEKPKETAEIYMSFLRQKK
jgi:pimeloyl-ACP methyl ester carboxylesterase